MTSFYHYNWAVSTNELLLAQSAIIVVGIAVTLVYNQARFNALEKRFEAMDKRLDDSKSSTDKRFDDLKSSIDKRFDDLKDWIRSEIRRLEDRIDRIEHPVSRP